MRDKLETYKQENEEQDLRVGQKLKQQEHEHQIYVKNLKDQIDQLA